MKWEDDGAWCGELTTRNTGECPNAVVVSRLSQILEETPHPKYNLTQKACQGILRRAERRGKDLPKLLKAVLIQKSQGALPQERTEAPAPTEAPTSYAVRIRGGCDGGGKGALVQTEKSGTLGTGNDQTIFCMATQQGGAELRTDDRAPTLTAGDRHGVAYLAGVDGYNGELTGDVASTLGVNCGMSTGRNGVMELSANENGGMARDSVLCAGFKAGQGAQAGGIGYGEEVSPALAAAPSGTNQTPAVMAFDTTQITSKENGSQPGFGKPCHTLNANVHVPCVALDMTHACDVIRECGEQVPALQARMGTGGNQVPLTYSRQAIGEYKESSTGSTCSARDFKDSTDLAITHVVVRRLTPMECERLQGFPDGWTDIGDWVKTDKRGREIKVKGSADSPRYKALGNSIALPFWDWMLRRMARYLPEDATLGSLFDGIAGFPLIWERIHGKGTARWASEIEPFPIAVTKKWFGEE